MTRRFAWAGMSSANGDHGGGDGEASAATLVRALERALSDRQDALVPAAVFGVRVNARVAALRTSTDKIERLLAALEALVPPAHPDTSGGRPAA